MAMGLSVAHFVKKNAPDDRGASDTTSNDGGLAKIPFSQCPTNFRVTHVEGARLALGRGQEPRIAFLAEPAEPTLRDILSMVGLVRWTAFDGFVAVSDCRDYRA